MFTPGYEAERKTKPAITSKIEETDDGLTAEQAALGLLRGRLSTTVWPLTYSLTSHPYYLPLVDFLRTGVRTGQAHISADFLTSFFRASTRGSAPYHGVLIDGLLSSIAWVRTFSRLAYLSCWT